MAEWNSGRVRRALVRYLQWHQTLVIPEFDLDGGRCDLVQISRAGYATEFEIKISRADWKADADKQKWMKPRPHIARFFYCVPEHLLPPDTVLDFVLPDAGILVCGGDGVGYDWTREHRPARRMRAQKVDDRTQRKALEAFYYRYWRHEADIQRVRAGVREANRTCPKCYHKMRCPACDTALHKRIEQGAQEAVV